VYAVGWFVQLALIVVCCPVAGEAGLALGVHTGRPPPGLVTQVTVCVGGAPDTVKLVHAGLVYVNVAASGLGDKAMSVPIRPSAQQRASGSAAERRRLAIIAVSAMPRVPPHPRDTDPSCRLSGPSWAV
jgi:hypothetical protein